MFNKSMYGMERVIQQTYTERRVERDDVAEKVVKNLAVTEIDEKTGRGNRVTISEQQLDPDYGLSSEGKDTITVKETVSVTPSYTSTAKDVIHEVLTPKLDIDPHELAKMVDEENQDVENTLKMVPPDITLREDRYAVKKRLQRLRLNTESMTLLEESVVTPKPTADEAIVETPPEALASVMHTVESGVTPECAPDQVFHTLFEEKGTEQSVILSSIGPGPLQDIIVPQVLSKDIHKESMTPDLTDLTNIYKNVTDAQDWPPVDIFASVMDNDAKSPKKGIKSRTFKPLGDEEMPWDEEEFFTDNNLEYRFFNNSSGSFQFRVKAPHNAHIALSSQPAEENPMYEIIIGGEKNTISSICKDRTKPDVVEVSTINILSATDYRSFWIRWDNGTISLGRKNEPEAFLSYTDDQTVPIQYVGVRTCLGSSGNWVIQPSGVEAVDLEPLVNIVGAEPAVVLDQANVPDLETSGELENELSHGIEYFVEADPVQYMSRVQLRGTQPPPWFPGYIYALPEFPDIVKLARNPDEVFISGWRSCQPKIIPDDSICILH